MTIFTNQAQLSDNDSVISSNVATGTILGAGAATKPIVMYNSPCDDVTL